MEPSLCCDIPQVQAIRSRRLEGKPTVAAQGEQTARSRALLVRFGFVALYIGVLAWFGLVDIYRKHFFEASPLYLGYTLARVFYITYLGWCQFYLGKQLLKFWQRRQAGLKLTVLDEYLLCFYAGGALLAGFTFFLGLLNLYYYWLFACGSVGLVMLSSAEFVRTGAIWWKTFTTALMNHRSWVRLCAYWLALASVLFLTAVVLLVKGLYPGGGGDYYTHYFPYFRHVLLSHGLWPNDVWYHFHISKGATITISSMLLTDPLASEVVTYLYFLVGCMCVYSLLRRCVNNRIVPCLGMAASLGAFIWTPNELFSDWGLFQKHHEFTASLLLSVVWLTVISKNTTGNARKAWMCFLSLAAMHCVLLAPTVFPLVFGVLGLVAALALLQRTWGLLANAVVGMTCASLVFGGLLTFNYLVTGLAEVTPMRLYWKYADQERFSQWVSPYLMTLMLEGSAPTMGDIQLVEHKQMSRAEYLRVLARVHTVNLFFLDVDRKVPIGLLLVLLVVCWRLRTGGKVNFELGRLAVPVVGLFLLAMVISQLVTQPVSIFRYFSFMVFLIVMMALGLWGMVFQLFPYRKLVLCTSYVIPAGLAILVAYESVVAMPKEDRKDILRFAAGQQSLAEGFRTRRIRKDVPIQLREIIGHEPRVYSFNINNYSMAPGCELETFVSFALHQDWHEIMFESPERAREVLKKQGLNYFLIDLDREVIDIIQYAPLFDPENISKFFAVRWRGGNAYLLTWADEQNTTPLSDEFLAIYSHMEFWNPYNYKELHAQVHTIYKWNGGNPSRVVRPPDLPPVQGWQ